MKITIDTDKKYIIVPDKFFAKIEELNAFRRENGVPEVRRKGPPESEQHACRLLFLYNRSADSLPGQRAQGFAGR